MKSSALTLLASLSLATILHSQDSPVAPVRTFDVTSVKESRSLEYRAVFQPGPTGINIQHATAQEIVAWAHDMLDRDVTGGPDWVRSSRFEIAGKSDGALLKPSEIRPMLRALLATRFELNAVIEPVEKPVYLLVRTDSGGPGPDLRTPRGGCNRPTDEFKEVSLLPVRVLRIEGCGLAVLTSGGRLDAVFGQSVTIPELAKTLSRHMDRPVIDRTGLAGEFDLRVGPGIVTRGSDAVPRNGFEWFSSLQDRLGFKMESTRAEVDTVVIRRIQKPTEN